MAIKKTTTFEGLKYNLDDRDRVAADAALKTLTDAVNTLINVGYISSGSAAEVAGHDAASSGEVFVTGSKALYTTANLADYLVLCIKK